MTTDLDQLAASMRAADADLAGAQASTEPTSTPSTEPTSTSPAHQARPTTEQYRAVGTLIFSLGVNIAAKRWPALDAVYTEPVRAELGGALGEVMCAWRVNLFGEGGDPRWASVGALLVATIPYWDSTLAAIGAGAPRTQGVATEPALAPPAGGSPLKAFDHGFSK